MSHKYTDSEKPPLSFSLSITHTQFDLFNYLFLPLTATFVEAEEHLS